MQMYSLSKKAGRQKAQYTPPVGNIFHKARAASCRHARKTVPFGTQLSHRYLQTLWSAAGRFRINPVYSRGVKSGVLFIFASFTKYSPLYARTYFVNNILTSF